MEQLQLYKHAWDAAGSGDAQSLQNAMGKTSLDMWNVLLRESLQNSWDARTGDQIRFDITEKALSLEATAILLNQIFAELPPEGASVHIRQKVTRGQIRVLTISDYGTRGLEGPIRANVEPNPGERSDFADFIRNFGRSHSKGLEGGTYGLGKGVLYSASQLGLCLVYSQPMINGQVEPRLIAVSGGDPDYSYQGLKYTGRNWWGVIAEDGIIDPLQGIDARVLAMSVGMPVPAPDETGTCIMVIAPQMYSENEGNVAVDARIRALREAAVLWAWPHALDRGNGPNIEFRFSIDGMTLEPIRPLDEPSVRQFAKAYLDVIPWRDGQAGPPVGLSKGEEILSLNPKKLLGHLVMRHSLVDSSAERLLENTVALMRGPRMIVKYMPVSAAPAEGSLFSVFVVSDEVENDFAKAEPVTHDDWIASKNRAPRKANFVNIALRRIKDVFMALHNDSARATSDRDVQGASHISSALGTLVGSFMGSGTSTKAMPNVSPNGGSLGGGRRAVARMAKPPKLMMIGSKPHVGFAYAIIGGKMGEEFRVVPSARVVVDGGGSERDDSRPLAGDLPEFAGWSIDGGEILQPDLYVEIPIKEEFMAVFRQPDDTAIKSSVELVKVLDNA